MKNKIIKSLVIVTAIIFALFFTREANASTEIAGGGEFYNGEETTINLDFDHRTTLGKWQYVIESDFYYQLEDDIEEICYLYELHADDDRDEILGFIAESIFYNQHN